jgi:hypothetical protein
MLVVDGNDRRGNELVWVSVADTIGATSQQKWGAHNGWHAKGGTDPSDPNNNIRGKDLSVGYTTENGGQPGTTWDLYNVNAAESADTGSGRLGSRLSDRGDARFGVWPDFGSGFKHSRQGPTPDMMNAYYSLLMYMSGDLNTTVLGPFDNMSSDDVGLITGWLTGGAGYPANDRGFWAIGDGIAEDAVNNNGPGTPQFTLLENYLGVDLNNKSYIIASGNAAFVVDLIPVWNICPRVPPNPYFDIYGVRNNCTFTNDVLAQSSAKLGETVVGNTYQLTSGGPPNYPESIHKTDTPAQPWKSLVDGVDIEHITSWPANKNVEPNTAGRTRYFNEVFTWLWSKICTITGTPIGTLDVPQLDNAEAVNFVNLGNNPMLSGAARIRFGLAKSDRVEIKVFDVSGRLVRSLADKLFQAGEHTVQWDGVDDGGKRVPRGVYFTQVKYQNSKFSAAKKLTVLQ